MTEIQESTTAKLCSFARAYHSNMDRQKIFDDYLAYDLIKCKSLIFTRTFIQIK